MQNKSISSLDRSGKFNTANRPNHRHEKKRSRRARPKFPGEIGPTWLLDARRIAGYVSVIACEMPVGRLLEFNMSNGSAVEAMIELLSRLVVRVGHPERVLVDRSAQFKAPELESWCESEGVVVVYLARIGITVVSDRQFRKLHGLETLGPNPTLADCRQVAARLLLADPSMAPLRPLPNGSLGGPVGRS